MGVAKNGGAILKPIPKLGGFHGNPISGVGGGNIHTSRKQQHGRGLLKRGVISIVLVFSAVFVPVAFMEGFMGVMQRQFALTLVSSVCFSGFVALTLTPALCALILQKKESEAFFFIRWFNNLFSISTKIYAAGVGMVLRHVLISLVFVGIIIYAMIELLKLSDGFNLILCKISL